MYFDIDYKLENHYAGDTDDQLLQRYCAETDTIIKETGKKFIKECISQILEIEPIIAVATASCKTKYSWRYFVPNIKMKKNVFKMYKCI